MISKKYIAYLLLLAAFVYIISPWFFEKSFFFNEALSASGLCILLYKRFKVVNNRINTYLLLMLLLCSVHIFVSLVKTDEVYYYLRNSVIFYSMFAYFVGYYCFPFFFSFIKFIQRPFIIYSTWAFFIPTSKMFFERFGVSTLFPYLFKKAKRASLLILAIINIIYAFTHDSATAIFISIFYMFLLLCPGYKFFKQSIALAGVLFLVFFISILPNLSIISNNFSIYNNEAIHNVMNSNALLAVDGNTTWRLVLWKQVIVDNFPSNIFGIGFGTPMFKYFPVEDFAKINSLPYVLGAHNSYVYLFGRLGICYVILAFFIYRTVFKEYFAQKNYYYISNEIFLFWSFFAVSIIALLNPVLESPIFAAGYWLILGLLAAAIHKRSCFEKSGNQ